MSHDNDSDTSGPHSAIRPGCDAANPMAEVLRIVQDMARKQDRQERELVEIKLRLERGASSIEASQQTGHDLRSVREALLVLQTRFAILWAAVGVAGGAGISGLVMAAFALIQKHP